MAKIGALSQSDAQRIAEATTYSRTPAQAEKAGPIARAKTPGLGAAIVSGGPRGVLKQANVGDVNSIVDKLAKGGVEAAAQVRAKAKAQSDAVNQQFQQQLTNKGGNVNSRS